MNIRQASIHDASHIAVMVKELTDEIIDRTGAQHFHVEVDETTVRCRRFLDTGLYEAYLALEAAEVIGFVAFCESHARMRKARSALFKSCMFEQRFVGPEREAPWWRPPSSTPEKKDGHGWSSAPHRFRSLSRWCPSMRVTASL